MYGDTLTPVIPWFVGPVIPPAHDRDHEPAVGPDVYTIRVAGFTLLAGGWTLLREGFLDLSERDKTVIIDRKGGLPPV